MAGRLHHVRLLIDTQHNVTTVPPTAIQRGPQGSYVYLLKDDTTVARRVVQVGHEDESVSVITAGLQPGDRVVTDGASRLTDGGHVRVQAPGATPESEAPPTERRRRAPGTGRQRASAAP